MADDSRKTTRKRGGKAAKAGKRKNASRAAGTRSKARARKKPAAKRRPATVAKTGPEPDRAETGRADAETSGTETSGTPRRFAAWAEDRSATVPVPEAAPAAVAGEAADPLARFFYRRTAAPTAGSEPPTSAEADDADAGREYLTFWLADEVYAVPVASLREIVRPLPVTEVPRTPAFVLGVVTLRGTVLPVFDLRLRLRLPAREDGRDTRVLVLDGAGGPAGIVADRVDQVVRADGDLEIAPQALGSGSEHIEGLLRRNGRMIIVLDLEAALTLDGRRTRETA